MTTGQTLGVYCLLIVAASLAGGWFPMLLRLTHRRLEILVSFVSGVMLGVALLHLLPHAWQEQAGGQTADVADSGRRVAGWLLAGFLVMFLIERFFCFHHHDAPADAAAGSAASHREPRHEHTLAWTGAAVGLTLHSVIAGMALGAAVSAGAGAPTAGGGVGLGAFLAIVLHKPFDAMTIGTLMAVGGRSPAHRHLVNLGFGLAVPAGAVLFRLGAGAPEVGSSVLAAALAFSAGTFLCISLSDLLPELQFHQHDRVRLSAALVLGLGVAWGAARLEEGGHRHDDGPGHVEPPEAGSHDHPHVHPEDAAPPDP